MAQNFFELSKATQTDILIGAQNTLGFEPSILEKDLWICAVLHELFSLPIPMAFKGGTSLSKGYGLIDRFSEDIDVTIDYRFFLPDLDLSQQTSRSALKKISGRLKERLVQYIKDIVVPHLQESLGHKYRDKTFQLELSDDGENLRVHYPPLFEQQENYLQHNVLLEFGGRNSIAPGEICEIIPYLATASEALYLPPAKVNVLSPLRTFWEKATLIHVECHRGRLESSPERLSRHWYDLATEEYLGSDIIVQSEAF